MLQLNIGGLAICSCGYPNVSLYRRHSRQHDEWLHGVKAKPSARYEAPVAEGGGLAITLVRPNAPFSFQRDRVWKVVQFANQEWDRGFSFKLGDDIAIAKHQQHALLGRLEDRIIALLVFNRRATAGYARWADTEVEVAPVPGGKWAVKFVWVLPTHRRKGVAGRLLEAALTIAHVPAHELAWQSPFSPDGRRFIERYCPEGYWDAGDE